MVILMNLIEDWLAREKAVSLVSDQIERSIRQAVGDDPARLAEAFMAAGNVRDVADPVLKKLGDEIAQIYDYVHSWANANGMHIPFWGVRDPGNLEPLEQAILDQARAEGKPDEVIQALARERYVPHYRKSELAQPAGSSSSRRSASTWTPHSMKRELTTHEALAKYGEDLITDIAGVTAEYVRRVGSVVLNKQMIDTFKQFVDPETGERVILPSDKAPPGWKPVPEPPTLAHYNLVQHMRARPDVADFLEDVFHKTGIERSQAWQKYQKMKRGITVLKMINPLVHGTNIVRAMLSARMNPIAAIMQGAKYWADDNPRVQLWAQKGLNFWSSDWGVVRSRIDQMVGRKPSIMSRTVGRLQDTLWNGIVRNGMIGVAERYNERFMEQGLDPEAAARLAAAWTNKAFGMIDTATWNAASRLAAEGLLFAPRWVTSRWDIMGAALSSPLRALSGAIKKVVPGSAERLAGVDRVLAGLGHLDRFSPEEARVLRGEAQKFLLTAIGGSYAVMNALNLVTSGHPCAANEKGHRFEVDLGYKVKGREQYLDLAGWIRDYVRMPGEPAAYWFYKMHPIPALFWEEVVGKMRYTPPYQRYSPDLSTPSDKANAPNVIQTIKNLMIPGVMGVPETATGGVSQLLGVPIRGGTFADPILAEERRINDANLNLERAYIQGVQNRNLSPFYSMERQYLRQGITTPRRIQSIMHSYRLRVIIEQAKKAGASPTLIRRLKIEDAKERAKWLPAADRAKALKEYIQLINEGAM
jgi:hypothetical protein